jgi:hypothetical protein
LIPGSLEAVIQSRDLTSSQKYPSADGRMRIKIGDEIKAELMGTMADHDGVGIGTTQKFIPYFEIIVDLLR